MIKIYSELGETLLCSIRKNIPEEKVEKLCSYRMKASGGLKMN
jgi:hypothetical protein